MFQGIPCPFPMAFGFAMFQRCAHRPRSMRTVLPSPRATPWPAASQAAEPDRWTGREEERDALFGSKRPDQPESQKKHSTLRHSTLDMKKDAAREPECKHVRKATYVQMTLL